MVVSMLTTSSFAPVNRKTLKSPAASILHMIKSPYSMVISVGLGSQARTRTDASADLGSKRSPSIGPTHHASIRPTLIRRLLMSFLLS